MFATVNPMSPDNGDWAWKHSQDTGLTYEQLFAADLSKSIRNGGKYPFTADAWIAPDALRGELAEKWEMKQNPLRVEVQLRKGIMFPAKAGVMESRELTADDVVFSYDRLNKSPKKIPGYFDHIDRVEATGKHSVTFFMKAYNAEWDYRFGWGYYSGIVPKEVVAAGPSQWKNVNGTGPFQLQEYVQGNSLVFAKNPTYWDKEKIGGVDYKLPFADKITYRVIKDETTLVTSLRTAKLDVLETVRWSNADELKKSAPKIQWSRRLSNGGQFVAMRMDQKPFDDIRVRRALNLAVNKDGDRQVVLRRQCRAAGLADAPHLHRLLRAARGDARHGEGALHLQPRQGQAAAGRGRLPQRLRVQGADQLVQHRGRPAADGGRLPRARSASRWRSRRWSTPPTSPR